MADVKGMCFENEISVKTFSARYQKLGEMGSGSFGTVSLCRMKPGVIDSQKREMATRQGTLMRPLSINIKYMNDLVAIKTMNKQLKKNSDYSRVKEIQFIFQVDSHFNLVQIIDVFIDRTHLKLNIVMENLDQNLYQLMKTRRGNVFSPKTLKSVLSQLLSALLHIHKHLFFHRDVKPENILVMQNLNYFGSRHNIPSIQRDNSYIIKLADYGLARHLGNGKQFTAYVSTRWYRSPEILLRQNYYSFPIDIWAFGCVAVECATFCPLFPGKNELDQCCKIMEFLGNPTKSFQLAAIQNAENSIYGYNYNVNHHYKTMVPFGGFWDGANDLAAQLGLKFPRHFGYRLETLVRRSDFTLKEKTDFFSMVKQCLTWDPEKRITALGLSKCEYFEDSNYLMETQKENETIDPLFMNTSNKSNSDSFIRSKMLAGILPAKNYFQNSINANSFDTQTGVLQKREVRQLYQPLIYPKVSLSSCLGFCQNKLNVKKDSNSLVTGVSQMRDKSLRSKKITHMVMLEEDYSDYVTFYPSNPASEADTSCYTTKPSAYLKHNSGNPVAIKKHFSNGSPEIGNKVNRTDEDTLSPDTSGKKAVGGCNVDNNDSDNNEVEVDEVDEVDDDDDDDDDEVDEVDDDDDDSNSCGNYNSLSQDQKLTPLEIGKISSFLQTGGIKVSEAGIQINRNKGNFDMIDALNFTLDDENITEDKCICPWDEYQS
ncbi:uncharacterized protein C5L36_0D05450 [Pichia kudriavzevii]|uniref:Protein kinase domain-containing protein n=1 Tax=Pichia kudriavzevii TaxID=4909 RepID=A0A2U9RA65_PICKU|nr:uncharacterized protein C5L36_0D05450 [Pichia kudriavzevii]AWU77818.1 hypothetical protein C5L36_0D05450 [Pichia kudriavzevii]